LSQENVEIVQRMQGAFNQRDLVQFFDTLDPNVEWIPIMAVLEGRSYHGHDGVRQWLEELGRDWEVFETYSLANHDLGDRVLSLGFWRARGRSSGVELEHQQASWIIDLETGKIVRLQTFTDRDEAFEAVRLWRKTHADSS
jgi:ketosteroid isomerase-like protein